MSWEPHEDMQDRAAVGQMLSGLIEDLEEVADAFPQVSAEALALRESLREIFVAGGGIDPGPVGPQHVHIADAPCNVKCPAYREPRRIWLPLLGEPVSFPVPGHGMAAGVITAIEGVRPNQVLVIAETGPGGTPIPGQGAVRRLAGACQPLEG